MKEVFPSNTDKQRVLADKLVYDGFVKRCFDIAKRANKPLQGDLRWTAGRIATEFGHGYVIRFIGDDGEAVAGEIFAIHTASDFSAVEDFSYLPVEEMIKSVDDALV